MELDEVEVIAAEALKAALDAVDDGSTKVCEIALGELNLGADVDVGGLELAQDGAEVGFGAAVSVGGGSVKVVDAELDGAGDCFQLVGALTTDHEAALAAAAEADF